MAAVRILTYKRTHIGDPDPAGRFGIHDCMGRIRRLDFDAVLGVGGIGSMPRSYGIDRKINWVGVGAMKQWRAEGEGVEVTFEHFRLMEEQGPPLHELAPLLAKRMYERGARFLLNGYTPAEQAEAQEILDWVLSLRAVPSRRGRHYSAREGCKAKCRPASSAEWQGGASSADLRIV